MYVPWISVLGVIFTDDDGEFGFDWELWKKVEEKPKVRKNGNLESKRLGSTDSHTVM